MCTVTIVSGPDGLRRIACNRDEQRTREPALPPGVQRCGGRDALMPIDPASGGTWMAVNDAGLVFVLINRNLQRSDRWQQKAAAQRSRGLIVPRVAAAGSLAEAGALLGGLNLADFALFRVVADDGRRVREWISDGRKLDAVDHGPAPLLFTSCGLGDALVEAPRRGLFEQMFTNADGWLDAQQRYHAHRWPNHPELSVDMTRGDAHTVSTTLIDVTDGGATMRYRDKQGLDRTAHLPLRVNAA